MIAIRIAKRQWGKAWRAMIEVAPVRLVASDPIYEVMPIHLEVLNVRGFAYEVVPCCGGRDEEQRHAAAH